MRQSGLHCRISSARRHVLCKSSRGGWALLFLSAMASPVVGQEYSPDRLWHQLPDDIRQSLAAPGWIDARLTGLRPSSLSSKLKAAPLDTGIGGTAQGVIIFLPTPPLEGSSSYIRVSVHESPVLPGSLASALPNFRTYSAKGVDDPSITARFEASTLGLKGLVYSPSGAYYIEPISEPGVTADPQEVVHAVQLTRDIVAPARPPDGVVGSPKPLREQLSGAGRPLGEGDKQPGQRTLRIAITATKEYSAFHRRGALTKEAAQDSVLLAIASTLSLVQAVYEREFGIRFELVAQEKSLIFVDADPFSRLDTGVEMDENQKIVDDAIGNENYDFAHVLSTAGGGWANIGVLCQTSKKARGASGASNPVARPEFAIDYVAHELGHQLGASHTFNSTAGGCKKNRYVPTAFEPGSGTTIMAYAGVCGADNVQYHSDPYFHAASLAQIADELAGASCIATTMTGNHLPTVAAAERQATIPRQTPFWLRASGNDSDGDALLNTWEEYQPTDWAPAANPPEGDADGRVRPLFRSFVPSASPAIAMPSISDLLSKGSPFASMPTVGRSGSKPLRFRVTARDSRGGHGSDDIAIIVDQTSGPLLVTRPTRAEVWQVGTQATVSWNVARTSSPPVSCAHMTITLSIDGGKSFKIDLAPRAPNTGQATVAVPPNTSGSSEAVVQVACADNIFFAISPRFHVMPPAAARSAEGH